MRSYSEPRNSQKSQGMCVLRCWNPNIVLFKWCFFKWCLNKRKLQPWIFRDVFHLFGRQNTEAWKTSGGLRWLTGWCEPPLAQCFSFAHVFIGKIDENGYPWRFCAKQKEAQFSMFLLASRNFRRFWGFQVMVTSPKIGFLTEKRLGIVKSFEHVKLVDQIGYFG